MERPRLVVAHSDRQCHALRRGDHPFVARPVGALSAAAFPLHGGRNHTARAGPEHSALACQSFRRRARRPACCSAAVLRITSAAVRLLGPAAAHDRGAVHPADGGVDARLHRALFLAAAEAVLQVGVAFLVRDRGGDAAARDGRPAPWRARGHSARQGSAMARAAPEADSAAAAHAHRQHHAVLFPDRLPRARSGWCSRARRALACASDGAAWSRCPIRTGRCACRRA